MKKRWLVIYTIIIGTFLLACSTPVPTTSPAPSLNTPSVEAIPGEVEASEFMGKALTPLSLQGNNALRGTQTIDRSTYRLTVNGLVENPVSLTYEDLLALPQISKLIDLNCVEGWNFTAKWTGPTLKSILEKAGVKPEAKNVIFYSTDVEKGYSSLLLDYVIEKDIIIGLKINDLTLPPERGFPFQVVAESKYGYKWTKWITVIELSDNLNFEGYWESYGYNNDANIGGPAFKTR